MLQLVNFQGHSLCKKKKMERSGQKFDHRTQKKKINAICLLGLQEDIRS